MISLPDIDEAFQQDLLSIRHHLHQHPEISWEEVETTAYIREQLLHIDGVELVDLGLQTGVVAHLKFARQGHCVALRADIDALKVCEKWDSPFKSLIEGKGHLCGHDFHTTGLIGAAKLLSRLRHELAGEVVFIFQPAEETTNGAREIIAKGAFDRFPIEAIFGLHNRPEVETGRVVVHEGPLMAAKINFSITVHGVGGHGSMPHKCVDPIVCASAIVQAVLTIPARNVDPMEALVLSICSIHGGTPMNLIVDQVEMTGSMRYHQPAVGERALARLKQVVEATAACFECKADFVIDEQVPAVINSHEMTEIARQAAALALGSDAIVDSVPGLATEDFADYMQRVPGFFYWLGSRQANEAVYSWHNEMFHVDDAAQVGAAKLLAQSALCFLTR